uniref:Phosphotransferase n=1 Tax=Panagrellus redivivus TaxID=6233 RepID=A0A7E5A1T4_PANRE
MSLCSTSAFRYPANPFTDYELCAYEVLLKAREVLSFVATDAVQEACKPLELSDDNLRTIMDRMEKSYQKGLSKEGAPTAAVKMLPSFVRSVPNGSENGNFLALDLGGTNFRVLLIRIDNTECEMTSKIFRVPESIMRGSGTKLFDHIAECLAKFIEEHDLVNKEKLPLGFTFSFPCQQYGLTCAKLVNWTKGFKCSGVEGNDVVQMLREACHRRGDIDIDVVAVLNDTTGTMMACAFKENSCNIGVICGTGSNACYMERLDRIPKIEGECNPAEDGLPAEMCVNTEWGGFGDDGALSEFFTEFDKILDEATINKGHQLFEKMVSGMYLGEIVRIILEHLAREGHLFGGDVDAIAQRGCFPTKFLSEIEGVYRFHPTFPAALDKKIDELLDENIEFQLMLSEDGSGRGAALVAAVATRMKQESAAHQLKMQNLKI